jgi:hypothetical protein
MTISRGAGGGGVFVAENPNNPVARFNSFWTSSLPGVVAVQGMLKYFVYRATILIIYGIYFYIFEFIFCRYYKKTIPNITYTLMDSV